METPPIFECRQQKKQQHTLPKPKITPWPKPTTEWAVPEITTPHAASPGAGCKTHSMVSYRTNSKISGREKSAFCPAQSRPSCPLINLQTSVKWRAQFHLAQLSRSLHSCMEVKLRRCTITLKICLFSLYWVTFTPVSPTSPVSLPLSGHLTRWTHPWASESLRILMQSHDVISWTAWVLERL